MENIAYRIFLVAYVIAAIATYGYAYNNIETEQTRYRVDQVTQKASGAAICAMVWPIYLSVIAFSAKEQP